MPTTTVSQLQSIQEKVNKEFLEEANAEMAASLKEKKAQKAAAEKKLKAALPALKAAGVDIAKLNQLDAKMAKAADREIEALEKQTETDAFSAGLSRSVSASVSSGLATNLDLSAIGANVLPKNTHVLRPAFGAVVTDDDSADTQTGVSQLQSTAHMAGMSHVVLQGAGCQNLYNWARGAGSGIFGTGAASITSDAYFGFWFRPQTTRYYSIRPLFRLRGYYILRANDGFFTSKYARVNVTCSSRTWQNNVWHAWDHENVLNRGDDNISVNRRFDIDRHTYRSSLLAGGDWAYIQCRVRLYAYARGSGSYARNEFSVGSANHICVPHVHVN